MVKDGCAFGRESRQMVLDIKDNIINIRETLKEIKNQNLELYNHQSSRWPPAAAWAIAVVSALLGGAVTTFASKLFS